MPTRELPHYWTPEQVRQILAAMPAGQPWLFALLLRRSALRRAKALDLQWLDTAVLRSPGILTWDTYLVLVPDTLGDIREVP